ncbi:3-hydroxyacyl-CoA dehydrogenase NAD-binding domain-containing protein [Coraliomargarita parva]|uniref:3-hydroxyacyl-CoA dehydrogenase NAD-binding domain-containing protein n=1 Tax=Coraliomargarita parva TaxID=3014050 RepID=UPI0022B41EC6|nr:3-hydroxyacyl-CoA dehydrogenase NAD-binding domain-containing protein [Coraliomargarita parva]
MKHLKFQINEGHAQIVFDQADSRANLFDKSTLQELLQLLTQVKSNATIRSLRFTSAKKGIFIAGADIKQLVSATPGELAALIDLGHQTFQAIEDLAIPTAALIDGACVGGGYELALACDWRIASDAGSTRIGLPETQLGILPAWGGSTRLPQVLGLAQALPLVLAGRVLPADKAKQKGLVDAVVPAVYLNAMADRYLERGKRPPFTHAIQNNTAAARLIEVKAEHELQQRSRGNYPAPKKALRVMCESVHIPKEKSFINERSACIELVSKPETTHLINLFLLREKAKKLSLPDVAPRPVERIAVLGSGVMGAGIAYWLSARGYPVLLQDVSEEALARGLEAIRRQYRHARERHIMNHAEARAGFDRIHATADAVPLHRHQVVIEAALEDIDVKKRIFRELESRCSEDCILASNTSALPLHEIAAVMQRPDRLVGLHFFNPAYRMPLVEVVKCRSTSAPTLATAIRFAQKIGKVPVVVQDSPGFLVNRILLPYLLKACAIFERGVDPQLIDEAMLDFGMPMGPMRLLDEIGLDVAGHVASTLTQAFPGRFKIPELLETIIGMDCLGRKNGKGFYLYKSNKEMPNREVLQLRESSEMDKEVITQLLTSCMSEEAACCLDEAVSESAGDIDFAMVMGTGYAPFRGGPLHYADSIGAIRPGFYPPAQKKDTEAVLTQH